MYVRAQRLSLAVLRLLLLTASRAAACMRHCVPQCLKDTDPPSPSSGEQGSRYELSAELVQGTILLAGREGNFLPGAKAMHIFTHRQPTRHHQACCACPTVPPARPLWRRPSCNACCPAIFLRQLNNCTQQITSTLSLPRQSPLRLCCAYMHRRPQSVRQLIGECWHQDPALRPPMARVRERLAAMAQDGTAAAMQLQTRPAACSCTIC